MFKEFASQISEKAFDACSDLKNLSTAVQNYESAWKGFDLYARERAPQIISSGIGKFYKDQFGLLSWLKLKGFAGIALEAYKSFGDVKGSAELIDISKESMNIMVNGPAFINEKTWNAWFDHSYESTVMPYDPSTKLFAPKEPYEPKGVLWLLLTPASKL